MKLKGFIISTVAAIVAFSSVCFAAELKINFDDGKGDKWTEYSTGTPMTLKDGAYITPADAAMKTLINGTEGVTDFVMEGDIKFPDGKANSGFVFRVTDPKAENGDFFNGYAIGIDSAENFLYLGRFDQNWNFLGRSDSIPGLVNDKDVVHLKVVVKGDSIKAYVNGGENPVLDLTDGTYKSGSVGIRSHFTAASFDNIVVTADAGLPVEEAAPAAENNNTPKEETTPATETTSTNPRTGDAGMIPYLVALGASGMALVRRNKK